MIGTPDGPFSRSLRMPIARLSTSSINPKAISSPATDAMTAYMPRFYPPANKKARRNGAEPSGEVAQVLANLGYLLPVAAGFASLGDCRYGVM